MAKTKEDVFYELLKTFENSERSVNRLISGDDEELISYGLKKIELEIKMFMREYKEAKL